MANKLIQYGSITAARSARGDRILRYSMEISHEGLKEHKLMSAPEKEILLNKVNLQVQSWHAKWENIESKRNIANGHTANQEIAILRTNEAEDKIKQIENILQYTLGINDAINWDNLIKNDPFNEIRPSLRKKDYPRKPEKVDFDFIPSFSFIDKLIKSKKQKKIIDFNRKYEKAVADWENIKNRIDDENRFLKNKHEKEIGEWEERRYIFIKNQSEFNKAIELQKSAYFSNDPKAIVEYCNLVLENSKYPEFISKDIELEYNPDTKILIVEYNLPTLESFPNISEVRYLRTRGKLQEYYINENQLFKMFDETIYKMALRTLHELFEADAINALDAISYNGFIESANKATGNLERKCIMSIQVKKTEFVSVDLSKIDPKACFKNLKGVGSSRLSSMTSIQPILQISKSDKRFIESRNVAELIDDKTNLAALDWEEFEHLIREIFEKEFVAGGGEVKVTQASRDGGVDAIAFDPDPIRGGKIVIQAKRYTNTVGVSAVRDLYGTVLNEGATKGILVTTSDYGPDAYEFAKGKPLTLLSGSNLLYLFEKHGHKAKIDLKEAKKILSNK